MKTEGLQALDEIVAKLLRDDSPISTQLEPSLTASVDQPIIYEAVSEASVIEPASDKGNETTMTDQPDSPLAGLNLETAIHLRWVLRDIKAKRMKLSPVNPDDLRTLIEMGLVEMRNDEPVLTNEGHRAIDWS
jgi:hypothetical protein